MIDRLYFVNLVLNATGLFSFLAPQFDVSVGQISLVLLIVNVVYLLVQARSTIGAMHSGGMVAWLSVMELWPLATLFYAPSIEMRDIGLQVYYCSLFLGAVVYTMANGLPAMHRVITTSIVLTVVGEVLSLVQPQYFEAMAELVEAEQFVGARAYGFFLQPNRLAIDLVFLFVGWFALWKGKNTLLEVPAILGLLLATVFTGSRTGVLGAVIVIGLIQAHAWKNKHARGKFLLKAGVMAACLVGGIVGMRSYLANMESAYSNVDDLVARMETMLTLRLTDDDSLEDDVSVQARIVAQATYWSLFFERPLLGHGFGADTHYLSEGEILVSSHSEALTSVMEYGILYPVAFALLVLYLFKRQRDNNLEQVLSSNSVVQFVIIFLLFYVIAGRMLEDRTVYVVWGMFHAASTLVPSRAESDLVRTIIPSPHCCEVPAANATLHRKLVS